MPRVLLLLPSSTYRAEAFLDAAARLRLDVTLGLQRGAVLPDQPADECVLLDFLDPEGAAQVVTDYARTRPLQAVLGVDDHTAWLAAHLAAALGLPHNAVEAMSAARNKLLMRERLRAHGVPVPNYRSFSIYDDPHAIADSLLPSASLTLSTQHSALSTVNYPCVLKPLALSASCGVIRANTPAEFVEAFRRITLLLMNLGLAAGSDTGQRVLVEDFVPGQEVALEGLITDGVLRVLALFDKPDPLDGPYFEETIYVTPSRLPAPTRSAIAERASAAAAALGLTEGPVHGELRINPRGVWVIELAARSIGGRCSGTVRFAGDLSLEELILRQALRLELPPLERADGAAGVMMLPIPRAGILRRVHGEDAARRVSGIEDVAITAYPGQELIPLPEGTRYLGFILAKGDTPEAVEASLREAHRKLEFTIEEKGTGVGKAPDREGVTTIRF